MKKIFSIIWLSLLIGQVQLLRAQSPGGVPGQTLWLKADALPTNTYVDGITQINATTKWLATTGNSAGQYVTGNAPVYRAGVWNFNPVVRFTLGGIGADYANTGSNYTAFTILNFTGSSNVQALDEVRVFSMAGGTNDDGVASTCIPVLGGNPLRTITNGAALFNQSLTGNVLNGIAPGIATTMRSSGTPASGNAANTLYAQWNGIASPPTTSGVTGTFGIDYYALGGRAMGSKTIRTGNGLFTGDIPEVIVYNTDLTATDRKKINSYLAIKYGITLDQSGGGQSYINAAGSTVWAADATYKTNIAGIGRDDNSGLYQKQSQSINTGNQVLIGLGNLANTNASNSGTLTNNQFLVWGDNGLAKRPSVAITGIAGVSQRFAAVWKVENTGAVGTVRVAWPQNTTANNLKLVQNASDPTFASGNTVTDMSGNTVTINGTVYNYADVTLGNGTYFTLAGTPVGPGGVGGNLGAWWKADYSASGTAWVDASGNNHNAALVAGTIAYNATAGGTNFNPNLTTSNGYMSYTSPVYPFNVSYNAYDSVDILAVTQPIINQLSYPMEEISNSGNSIQIFHQSDNNAYMEMPFPNRLSSGFTGNGGTYGVSNIFEGSKNGTAMTLYLQARQILSGTASLLGNYSTGGGNTLFGVSGLTNSGNSGVSEIICFTRPLTVAQRSQVNSYIAIKYGITLDQGGSGQNYINSGGLTVWTADATFKNNIAGIARDDNSSLYQKQSQSNNTGNQVLIGLGNLANTNSLNSGTLTNNQFLVWGDNGLAKTLGVAISGIAGVSKRFAAVWKVQNTGAVGTVRVAWPKNSTVINLKLVQNASDPTFASGNTVTDMISNTVTINGTIYNYADVTLGNGTYFTLAGTVVSPGGVTGARLWLKADAGTSTTTDGAAVATWQDNSGNGFDLASPNLTTNAALFRTSNSAVGKNFNFNPYIDMTGARGVYSSSATIFNSTNDNATIFTYLIHNGATGGNMSTLIDFGNANPGPAFYNDAAKLWFPAGSTTTMQWYGSGNAVVASATVPDVTAKPSFYNVKWSGPSASQKNLQLKAGGKLLGSNSNATPLAWGGASASNEVALNEGGIIGDNVGSFYGSEYLVYNRALTDSEEVQVNSYLAIKYGQTVSQDFNGNGALREALTPNVNEGDYLASDGTKIWNAVNNASYNNNIAGIARDDNSGLYQKQSQSINTGNQVLIGLGNLANTNGSNSGTLTNNQFLVWGDNGLAKALSVAISGIAGINQRFAAVWKVQNTGAVGTVRVAWPQSATLIKLKLLQNASDPAFASGNTITDMSANTVTINGVVYNYADVTLANGTYFTLAGTVVGPGGVTGNLGAWWKADVSATNSSWNDVSGNGHNATTASGSFTYNAVGTGANFNPSITTGGGYMTYNQPVYGFQPGYNSYDSVDLFTLVQPIANTNSEPFCEHSNLAGPTNYLRIFHASTTCYFDAPETNRINAIFSTGGGTYGVSNIMEGRKSGTAMSLYLQSRQIASGVAGTGGNYSTGFNALFGFSGETTTGNAGTSEIIAFTHPLTAAERQQVNSYLALKYGITLDQTSATNYLASDGVTKMWDAASGNNPTYSKNIAGIARDDNSSLYQKQSQSINTGNQVLIGLGNLANTNGSNSGTLTNNQFLVWGDNGLAKTLSVAISGIAGINQRFAAVWKVQNTGAVGTVRVAWPQSATLTKLKLVQNASDPTFASGNTITDMSANTVTINGTVYNYADVTLANGSYFTLAGFTPGPGGVAGNLGAWWKADFSATSGNWNDATGNINHNASFGGVGSITFTAARSGTNFNPTMVGNGGYMNYNSPVYGAQNSYDKMNIFEVTQPVAGFATYGFSEISNNVTPLQFYHWVSDGIRLEVASPNELTTTTPSNYLGSNIIEAYKNGTSAYIYLQYKEIKSSTTMSTANLFSNGSINRLLGNGSFNTGGNSGVSEIIAYTQPLTLSQRQQVNSYLALKYGVTLDQGNNGTDYLASDGSTKMWDATSTGNFTYSNNIAGIGRDDGSVLLQKQSLSVNAGNQLAVSLGAIQATNILNTGDLSASDNQFLVWGDDNGATTINTATGLPGIKRFARTWMLQRSSNFTGNSVTMYFPASTFGSSNPVLLIYGATAASLNNGTANVIANSAGTTTINGASYYAFAVPSAKLASIQYFSFATNVANPGGVAGQTLWLKADQLISASFTDNTTITTANKWLATTGNAAGQYVTDAAPVFRTGAWNFNPVVRFNLGAIGADYTNTGSNYTAFTTLNFTGSSSIQGSDEVRVLSMAGGANDDGVASTCIPVLGGNPLRTITNGAALYNQDLTGNVLNGIAPGIATTMRSSGTPASGNIANTLYAQWNGIALPPTTSGVTGTFNIDYYTLGGRASGSKTITPASGLLTGDIPEVIVYNTDLTAADRQKINSYLAIKYGITLNQTAPGQSYLNSAATTIWTGNTTYVNDIIGIGRDDASALNQKQSKSINTNSLVVLGLGSIATDNTANTNSFGGDNSFDICGADNGSTSFVTYFPYGQVTTRMTRIWKMQETGTVGAVQVAIPASAVPAGLSNVNLLVSGSATFNGTATRIPMTLQTINGTQYYAATVDFSNGQFFTFGAYQSPSNILINPTRGTRLRAQ